jgi:hypothetical protein
MEGQGMADATVALAALRASKESTQEQVTTGTPKHRHSLRNGFTAYTLPGVPAC